MMQAADLSNGDNLSDPGWHDRARVRTILVERKMSPSSMVVIDIRGQDAAQMALVEDHEVVETFAPDRTDHSLDVGVLPWGAWRCYDFSYAHRLDPFAED